ncbi:MAG: M48 family metallopeptidase [Syntrophaceae bacterium]|nr:M48 family metallopeptidase [Syntrophaceae bacterium]
MNLDFDFKIVRRPGRRTASISVKDDSVIVIVPDTLSNEQIERVVKRKARWIIKKLKFHLEVRKTYRPKEYVSGESFSYLGRNYRLKVLDGKPEKVSLRDGRLYVHAPHTLSGEARDRMIVAQLTDWYQEHALIALKEKAKRFSAQVVVQPKKVGIKSYKSRWGSCNSQGEVLFNWRIIMAPQRIIDYVVAHEICHLVHHNHSKSYYKLLESVVPDYKECKEWLKVNGQLLNL